MDKEFNLVAAIRIILKWKRPIIILTLVAGIVAGLFSVFVMDEYYFSWATFYPTNQYLGDRSVIFNSETTGGQLDYFGGKGDINRILTIANSEPVMNYIIDSFKLTQHYKIDTNKRYWRTKVRKEFDKNYEAIKTEKDAVQISDYDTDPKTAAAIVNAVMEKVDVLNKQHIQETKESLYKVLSTQIDEQQKKVNENANTLASMASEYNIRSTTAAGNTILVEGKDFKAVQEYKALLAKQENALKELNNRNNIKEQMEVAMKNNASSLFVIENAFAADRREKPVRSLVVLITMLITAFVSIIGVFLIEQIHDLKKQL